jgi:hypothetical protein
VLAIEVGAGSAGAVAELMRKDFQEVAIARDYARIERVVSGVLPLGA